MSQDERYKKAVHEFYGAYRELQKRMNLRMASHFSMYTDNYIEIWEYRGEVNANVTRRKPIRRRKKERKGWKRRSFQHKVPHSSFFITTFRKWSRF